MIMHYFRKTIIYVILAALPSSAVAVPLAPGGNTALAGTTAAAEPNLAGAILNDNIIFGSVSPSGNPFFQFSYSVQNRVVESSATGTLTFAPRLRNPFNVTSGNFQLDQIQIDGFAGYSTSVDYRIDGLGDRGPTSATRSADGNRLTFDFGFPLILGNLVGTPQETSKFLSIETDATAYNFDGRLSLFGRHLDYPGETFSITYSGIAVPTFATDIPAVPIPASMAFMLSWIGLAGAVIRRRKSKAAA